MKKKLFFLVTLITACLAMGATAMATEVLQPSSGNGPALTISSYVYKTGTVTISGVSDPVTVYYVPDGTEMSLPEGYVYEGAQFNKSGSKYVKHYGRIFENNPGMAKGDWRNYIYCVTPAQYTDETKKNYTTYDSFYFFQCDRSANDSPFVDVKDGSKYYFVPTVWAYETGRTSGTDATHFSPSKTCSRAEMITFLWNAAGKPEPVSSTMPFVDVSAEKYYYKAVLWAYENDITAGIDATHFGPKNACTRSQAVALLYRTYGEWDIYVNTVIDNYQQIDWKSKPSPFTDVTSGSWYYDAVRWAYYNDITSGVGNKKFDPNGICTRGQMITFFFNISQKS